MPSRLARAACLCLVLLTGAVAKADDLADFNAAVEAAAAHNRVAIGYLRTGNADLAALEIDRLRAAWGKLVPRFTRNRPAVFDGNALYAKTLNGISARLVAADLLLNAGRLAAARGALQAVRGDLYALRQSAGVVVLADCILDANKAAAAFMAYDKRPDEWSKPEFRRAITENTAAYAAALDRCNKIAGEKIRKEPEFRRLIDSAKEELGRVPSAIETRNPRLFHRVVISLRAIDNLLTFRFG
jgi:hypothetical protein